MKITKGLILVTAVLFHVSLSAQQYKSYPSGTSGKESAEGVVYYIPKTDVVITFKTEKVTRTKGIYSDNAYLLGIDNSALKNSTSYRIKSCQIRERISADYDKKYVLSADNNTVVEKAPSGILKSVTSRNTGTKKYNSAENNVKKDNPEARHNLHKTQNNPATIPVAVPTYEKRLMEQGLLVRYPQMTAEKAVAEIKRLRDKQIELLSGAWEGTYMNTTVDYMYKQLDEMINTYVSLFTGVETVSEEEYTFVITPDKPLILEEDLLLPVCKFSQTSGFSDLNESTDGVKIIAKIHSFVTTEQNLKNQTVNSLTEKQKSKLEKEGAGIYYGVPQTVRISLLGADMANPTKEIKLMQYGSVAFTSDHTSNIVFDGCTGEIIKMW